MLFYADADFHPDAFAALSGTLVAGGVMIWLCPSTTQADRHNKFNSVFIERMLNKAYADDQVLFISPDSPLPQLDLAKQSASSTAVSNSWQLTFEHSKHRALGCLSAGQETAVKAILKVVSGHRNRPLVLTADRGRGKSAALAIASAQLMLCAKQPQKILVSAPHQRALTIFFKHLQYCCPQGNYHHQVFTYMDHQVIFVPVEQLLKSKQQATVLLIDEAAAIPIHLLSQLLSVYHRIVFSSTLHGYEGSGGGFALKFLPKLQKMYADHSELHINEPIRWAKNDPLERFVFDCFLLSSPDKLSTLSFDSADWAIADVAIQQISQHTLQSDESLLVDIFAVLVTAHYQTSPSDLKLLLSNPQVRVFVSFYRDQVLGVALTLLEGQASTTDIAQFALSEKQLANQFLPQSLYRYSGIDNAFDYRYLRIMRIAVHPSFQRLGIGNTLLNEIEIYAKTEKIDVLGTSFAATTELMSFWFANRYQVARLGFTRDKSSGEHSALLLQGLNHRAEVQIEQIVGQFYRSFSFYLAAEYQQLSAHLVVEIINQWPKQDLLGCTSHQQKSVADYLDNKRQLLPCLHDLHLWLIDTIACYDSGVAAFLIARVLQRIAINELCANFGFTGKKQLDQHTNAEIRRLNTLRLDLLSDQPLDSKP